MLCCLNTESLGCYDSCLPVNTMLISPVTGTLKVYYRSAGLVLNTFEIQATQGQEIILDNVFLEGSLIKFYIVLPNGTRLNNTCYTFENLIVL